MKDLTEKIQPKYPAFHHTCLQKVLSIPWYSLLSHQQRSQGSWVFALRSPKRPGSLERMPDDFGRPLERARLVLQPDLDQLKWRDNDRFRRSGTSTGQDSECLRVWLLAIFRKV